MSSTVLTGKRAAAFQKADGGWIYALFERTYESNCYPHVDKWSAIALGGYAEVMRRVFSHATSCEGGMLRSRAGQIKPENYIESWRRELSKPSVLRDRQIELAVGTSLYSAVPKSQLEDVRLALIRSGFEEQVSALASGELTVSLHANVSLLLSIYGTRGPLSVWRILDIGDCGTSQIDVPTPPPMKTALDRMPRVRCHAIDRDNRLISIGYAPWRHAGWQYNAVGSFITEVAYPIEMETPGFAKKAIPAFRDAVRGAEVVPSSARITVTRSPEGAEDWKIRRADEIAQGLGIATAGEPAPDEFSFSFGDLLQAHESERLLYAIGGLSDAQAHWEVPALREGTAPDFALIAAEVQMSLCLA